MKNVFFHQIIQILLSNILLLSIVVWFDQSLDSIFAYLLFTVAFTSLIAVSTINRRAYKADGLRGLLEEKCALVTITLIVNSLWLSAVSYDFLYTGFEQSAFANNQYVFYIVLTTVVITTITNRSVLRAGKILGTSLHNRNTLVIMLAVFAIPPLTFFSMFYLLSLMDASMLSAALVLIVIKTATEIIFDRKFNRNP